VSISSIPGSLRRQVADRDAGRCRYCGLHQHGQAAAFHVDHVVPRSRGGQTILENLVLQCPYCSLHKSNKLGANDPLDNNFCPLFHPLNDQWSAHFRLLADGECHGTTAIGRATVDALRMNDPIPKIARAMQILSGMINPD
jgi:5-methylcytosine-specific restriction endonuclease McrA